MCLSVQEQHNTSIVFLSFAGTYKGVFFALGLFHTLWVITKKVNFKESGLFKWLLKIIVLYDWKNKIEIM